MSDPALNTPRPHSTSARVLVTGIFLALVLALVAIATGDKDVPPPPQVVAAAQTHTAQFGESWVSIAEDSGIGDWHVLMEANMDLVRKNTSWCKARVIDGKPISKSYLTGFLADGKTRRNDDLCQLFPYKGEELAITTLLERQTVTIPPPLTTVASNDQQ